MRCLTTRRHVLVAAAGLSPALLRVQSVAAATPPTAYLPGDAYVESYVQRWALSCEFAATHTALRLVGHHVPEDTMRALLGNGEDPDQTFRGEIQANQTLTNYGVHAKGIARLIDLLRAGGYLPREVGARLLYEQESIRAALAASQPVVAWLPLDLRASSRVPTRLSNGSTVNLVPAEHTVTLRGYDGQFFYALDPHHGTTPRYEAAALWRGMSLFDDPALAIGIPQGPQGPQGVLGVTQAAAPAPPPVPPPAPALPTSEFFPESGITLDGGFYRSYLDAGGRAALGVPITEELSELDPTSGATKQVVYTEAGRLEWYPGSGTFGLGFAGQELLGDAARPDPARRLGGAIGRYVAAAGGVDRFGYSISDEVPLATAERDLVLHPLPGAVAQWFQTGLLVWESTTNTVIPGRVGLVLAKDRGYFS